MEDAKRSAVAMAWLLAVGCASDDEGSNQATLTAASGSSSAADDDGDSSGQSTSGPGTSGGTTTSGTSSGGTTTSGSDDSGGSESSTGAGGDLVWDFDDDQAGTPPSGFAVASGEWNVEAVDSAPSGPNVYRQSGEVAHEDFTVTYLENHDWADLTARVDCMMETDGDEERRPHCGLIFRLQDADNYYVVRANSDEGNVSLYILQNGERENLVETEVELAFDTWGTLEVTAVGEEISASWNGTEVLTFTDSTYASGKVGLWTKSDAHTSFDNLEVEPQ